MKASLLGRKRFPITVFAAFFLTGCAGDFSTLDPAGPSAGSIAVLWWIMLSGGAVIFALTSLVLILSYIPHVKKRLRPRFLIVWSGVVIPSAMLTALVIAAFTLGENLRADPTNPAQTEIEVVAHQWGWEFRDMRTSETVKDVAYIPAGQDVDFVVTSRDVVHSFWVPRLGGKIDAIPGHVNRIRLRADAEGTYRGVCAEFCGTGHAIMPFSVIAVSEAEYAAAARNGEAAQ